ncbi:MAG: hypothetical protein R3C53_16310 [Pirellulaceae bacterium]
MTMQDATTLADANLAAYFEQREKDKLRVKKGGYVTTPLESPHLAFFEPLWNAIPREVYAQNGPYVIGTVHPHVYAERSDNHRTGIWNAATGGLECGPAGAVCIAWNPAMNQIAIWLECDYQLHRANKWIFERLTWPAQETVATCTLDPKDHWPCTLTFPKKYNGRVAKLQSRSEDGTRTMYVQCMDDGHDREITFDEANAMTL